MLYTVSWKSSWGDIWNIPTIKIIKVLNYICTLMFPALILANVPTSKTGVLPDLLLSSRGPSLGRWSPNRAVSPSMRRDIRSKNWSTRLMGSHLSKHMESPKVDLPSISWGKTWTCNIKKKKKEEVVNQKPRKRGLIKDESQKARVQYASSRTWLPCHFSIPKNLQTLTLTVEYFIEKSFYTKKKVH